MEPASKLQSSLESLAPSSTEGFGPGSILLSIPLIHQLPENSLPIDAKQIFSSSSEDAKAPSESDSESSSEEGIAEIGGLEYNEADVDPFDPNVEQYEHLIPKADTIDINAENGKIEKSSISAAVYHLLHMSVDRDDPNFVTNMSFLRGFIWNFDLFITPSKLMQIIIIFYRIRMNQNDLESGKRLIGFLAELINARFLSLETCKPFKRLFLQFFQFIDKEEHTNSQFIMNTWTANQNKELNFKPRLEISHFFGSEPLPIQTTYYSVTDFSPLSTAQVFSEVNQVLFFNITMIEFRAWSTRKNHPTVDFSNIDRLIEWYNQLTCYVQTTLVVPLTMTVKEQVKIYSHWIQVMQCMVDLQNFEGIAPIFFGLSSPSAISKLEALLPKDLKQIKQSMEALVGPAHNYLLYRSTFEKNINKLSPYVPQQCVLLKDLTCLEENKTILKGKVHWFKLTLVGEILDSIRLARSRRFHFWQNSQAEAYINDIFIFLANGYRNRLIGDKLQEVIDARVKVPDTPEKQKFAFLDKNSSNPIVKAMSKRDSLGSAERRKRDSISSSEDHSLSSIPEKNDGARDPSHPKKRGAPNHLRRPSDSQGDALSMSAPNSPHGHDHERSGMHVTSLTHSAGNVPTGRTVAINVGPRSTLTVSSGPQSPSERRRSTGSGVDPACTSQTSSDGPSPRHDMQTSSTPHSGASSPQRTLSPFMSDSSGSDFRSSGDQYEPLSPHGKKKEKVSALDKVMRYVNKPSLNNSNSGTPRIVEPGEGNEHGSDSSTPKVTSPSTSSAELTRESSHSGALSPMDGVFKVEEKRRNRSLSDVTMLKRPSKK